jgi:hypothetical protein
MSRPIEVADIFRVYGPLYRNNHKLPVRYLKVMRAIETCRTHELGGHKYKCDTCGSYKISYNSCRNRHCPKCQNLDKERWLEARKKEVLPVHYFHAVFTLPENLRPLSLRNQEESYNILFQAVSDTLKTLSRDPKHIGAEIGFITVLHTWSQTLIDHPHIHCIIPGGGLSFDGKRWISCKDNFFIPVKVLSRIFRGKYLDYLKQAYDKNRLKFTGQISSLGDKDKFNKLLNDLYDQDWHVYCKPPFKKPESVIEYLGRYTHRVAISNNRIVRIKDDHVTIKYRDYSDGDKIKDMELEASEFIRRFLLHVLPDQFFKIRYYGFLSARNRKTKLVKCKELLGAKITETEENDLNWQDFFEKVTGIDPTLCPVCKKGRLIYFETINPVQGRSPP